MMSPSHPVLRYLFNILYLPLSFKSSISSLLVYLLSSFHSKIFPSDFTTTAFSNPFPLISSLPLNFIFFLGLTVVFSSDQHSFKHKQFLNYYLSHQSVLLCNL